MRTRYPSSRTVLATFCRGWKLSQRRATCRRIFWRSCTAGLGERNRVFFWLDRAVADRSDVLVYLGVEPRLDSLRSDPRYQALLRRVNLRGQ